MTGRDVVCSARRCRAEAVWALRWNNPALHEPDYRKVWTACAAHREHLTGFLQGRGFTVEVVPMAELLAAETGDGTGTPCEGSTGSGTPGEDTADSGGTPDDRTVDPGESAHASPAADREA